MAAESKHWHTTPSQTPNINTRHLTIQGQATTDSNERHTQRHSPSVTTSHSRHTWCWDDSPVTPMVRVRIAPKYGQLWGILCSRSNPKRKAVDLDNQFLPDNQSSNVRHSTAVRPAQSSWGGHQRSGLVWSGHPDGDWDVCWSHFSAPPVAGFLPKIIHLCLLGLPRSDEEHRWCCVFSTRLVHIDIGIVSFPGHVHTCWGSQSDSVAMLL